MNAKDVLIGVVIGAMIGAVTMLLTAPISGKAMRGELNDQTARLKNKTANGLKNVAEQSNQAGGQAQNAANPMNQTTADTAERFLDELTSSGNEDRDNSRE